jgi:hypothetical protein
MICIAGAVCARTTWRKPTLTRRGYMSSMGGMGRDGLVRVGIGVRGGERTHSSRQTDSCTLHSAGAFTRRCGYIVLRCSMATVPTRIRSTDFVPHQPTVRGSITTQFDPLGRAKMLRHPPCIVQGVSTEALGSPGSDKHADFSKSGVLRHPATFWAMPTRFDSSRVSVPRTLRERGFAGMRGVSPIRIG